MMLMIAVMWVLMRVQKVKFLSEDIALECEGKEAYKCAEDVFWKGKRGE
jgi:hypothetical protein